MFGFSWGLCCKIFDRKFYAVYESSNDKGVHIAVQFEVVDDNWLVA